MARILINHQITATELRVILEDGTNLGVLSKQAAIEKAMSLGADLIEISPTANPPVAKIMDYGKFEYAEAKKAKASKAKAHTVEIKTIQVKTGTGDHDLELKAKKASEWLSEGHRVRLDLFLPGRAKYLDQNFLKERMERLLKLVTVDYKIADAPKKSPKGLTAMIEKA